MSSFVPHLLQILTSDDHDRSTKLQALCSLGDLCIYAGVPFIKVYLEETLRILGSAATLTLQKSDFKDDPDTLDYLKELQQHIMDCYSSLVSSCAESNLHFDILMNHMPKLFFFL